MKTRWLVLVALFLTGLNAAAQITGFALDDDPLFTATLIRHIHYPVTAVRESVYGRFFVKFSIDSTGTIQNITVLYPKISPKYAKRLGFEHEIINGFHHIPVLSPRYKGGYILPIAFVYTNYSEDSRPLMPTNTLPETYSDNSLILNEIRIDGSSNMYRTIRPFSGIAPASRQMVMF